MPEADTSDMEDFVLRLQVLLPVLGIQFLRPTPNLSASSKEPASISDGSPAVETATEDEAARRVSLNGPESPVFKFSSASVQARAVEVGGQMVVLKGSQAQPNEQSSLGLNARAFRDQLKRTGKLVRNNTNNMLDFTDDVAFSSPSAAAQCVMGTSRNGRIDWIVESTGQTYEKWQEARIKEAHIEAKQE